MSIVLRLLRPALKEVVRSRWLPGLVILLIGLVELLLRFSGSGPTLVVSLIDVALILTPLVGLVVGTVQVHQARPITALLLAQPVARGRLFLALYLGNALPLAAALCVGLLAPLAWHGMLFGPESGQFLILVPAVVMLAMVSSALAFVIALRVDDRMRALGVALGVWLVSAVLWDGVILLVALIFGQAAIEIPLLTMLALNPLDLARVLLLLGTDAAALLGYTGAMLQSVLGTTTGRMALAAALLVWFVVPLTLARRTFATKDF